jgi:hypothetical protein
MNKRSDIESACRCCGCAMSALFQMNVSNLPKV